MKIVEFENHRRFTLRCLSKGITPVNIKLKSTFRTPQNYEIIKTAERQLLNEHVRTINNTIEVSGI